MNLFIITITASLLSALILWLFLKDKIQASVKLLFFGIILSGIGVYLVYGSAETISTVLGKQHTYHETKGVVLNKYIAGERAFHPEIIYRFKIDETEYIDSTTMDPPMFGGKRKKYDVAKTILEDYEVGDSVSVIYNPNNPEESYLKLTVKWNQFVILFFGYLLMACGLLFVLHKVFYRNRATSSSAAV